MLARLLRHLSTGDARALFRAADMDRIAAAIRDGECRHRAEVCFAVESALHWRDVLRHMQARDRAVDAFSRLRVWDTGQNTGVLVYLLLADHRIEIVADRGLRGLVSDEQWRGVCQLLEERMGSGDRADAVVDAIGAISDLLEARIPQVAGRVDADELPDQPVFL